MKIIYTIKEAEEVLKTLKGCDVEIKEYNNNIIGEDFSVKKQIKFSEHPEAGTSGQMGTSVKGGAGAYTGNPGGGGEEVKM